MLCDPDEDAACSSLSHVADDLIGSIVGFQSEPFEADAVFKDPEIDETIVVQILESLQMRIITCNEGLVIVVVLKPLLQRLESSEVNDPTILVELIGVEEELELQSIAMKKMAMRLCPPLSEAAGESKAVWVDFLDVKHSLDPFR